MFKILKKLLPKTNQQLDEEYLAASSDLVDLERRQKQLLYGRAYSHYHVDSYRGKY
jgi:hypothetical protein